MSFLTNPRLSALMMALVVGGYFYTTSALVTAQEQKAEALPAYYTASDKATAKELLEFCQKVAEPEEELTSQKQVIKHYLNATQAILVATERILAEKELDEETLAGALQQRFIAFGLRQELLPKESTLKARQELAKKYLDDKRPLVANLAKSQNLICRAEGAAQLPAKEHKTLVADIVTHVKAQPEMLNRKLKAAAQFMSLLESPETTGLAADLADELSEAMTSSLMERTREYGKYLKGAARRLRLPGNEIELEGTTLSGKPFDWSKYRGKVVFVDFWATTCGICVAEMPNVHKLYEKYHDQGLEVVGITLDVEKRDAEEFLKENDIPWVNLISTDEDAMGWDSPLAVKYGVSSLPFTVLVGKDGKVLKTNIHGEELEAALKELFEAPGK